jgi:hypothetical protein
VNFRGCRDRRLTDTDIRGSSSLWEGVSCDRAGLRSGLSVRDHRRQRYRVIRRTHGAVLAHRMARACVVRTANPVEGRVSVVQLSREQGHQEDQHREDERDELASSSIAMLRSLFIVCSAARGPRVPQITRTRSRTWRARAFADQLRVPDNLAQDTSEHRAMGEALERLDKSYDFDLRAAILWRGSRFDNRTGLECPPETISVENFDCWVDPEVAPPLLPKRPRNGIPQPYSHLSGDESPGCRPARTLRNRCYCLLTRVLMLSEHCHCVRCRQGDHYKFALPARWHMDCYFVVPLIA